MSCCTLKHIKVVLLDVKSNTHTVNHQYKTSNTTSRQFIFTWKPSIEFWLCIHLILLVYSWMEIAKINIMDSKCVKCSNYIVICNLVLEHYFLPSQTERVNGIKYLSASTEKGVWADNICLLYYGHFDLCPVQMGCHASWFHTANATVTNDSGCDPMTGTFTRTNKRPDEWASVAAAVNCPSCPMKPGQEKTCILTDE